MNSLRVEDTTVTKRMQGERKRAAKYRAAKYLSIGQASGDDVWPFGKYNKDFEKDRKFKVEKKKHPGEPAIGK